MRGRRGLFTGGPQCRMSNLRKDHVPCHYFCNSLVIFKYSAVVSQIKGMAHVMSLIFFPSVAGAHFDFRKWLCRDVKFKGQEPRHCLGVCLLEHEWGWGRGVGEGGGGKGREGMYRSTRKETTQRYKKPLMCHGVWPLLKYWFKDLKHIWYVSDFIYYMLSDCV